MKTTIIRSLNLIACVSLMCSCQSNEAAALLGGIAGAGVAALAGERDAGRLVLAGIGGAVVGVVINETYHANKRQEELARSRATQRYSSPRVRSKMQSSGVKKMAVVVPQSGGKKKGVMLVDEKGNPTDGKVYVPQQTSNLKEGEVISLGLGKKAYLANSWQGV